MWRTQGAHRLKRDADGLDGKPHDDPRLHAIAANIDHALEKVLTDPAKRTKDLGGHWAHKHLHRRSWPRFDLILSQTRDTAA